MKSILHDKSLGTCYLCAVLNTDFSVKTDLEAHHVFGGNPNRKHSEKYGLKVYLCRKHHRESDEAVHRPDKNENQRLLYEIAQAEFEKRHTRAEFMAIFGKSYL